MAATDANNMIFYIDASRNYDPSPRLDQIKTPSSGSTPPTTSSTRPS
jgi:hypothetical protein